MSLNYKKSRVFEKICCTCLSGNRRFTSLNKYKNVIPTFLKLSEEKSICWECEAVIIKWTNFILQIENAQHCLNAQINISSLSKLTKVHKDGFDKILEFNLKEESQDKDKPSLLLNQEVNQTGEELNTTDLKYENRQEDTQNLGVAIKIENVADKDVLENDFHDEESSDTNSNNFSEHCNSIKVEVSENEISYECEIQYYDSNEIKSSNHEQTSPKPNTQFENFESVDSNIHKSKIVHKKINEEELLQLREKEKQKSNFKSFEFKCTDCIIAFKTKEKLDSHVKNLHTVGTYVCDICKCNFDSERTLFTHKSSHYVKHCCSAPDCSFEHLIRSNVNRHYNAVHVVRQSYKCSRCKETFPSRASLRAHREKVHVAYECNFCGKRFGNSSNLKKHIFIHTGQPILECDICGKSVRGCDQLSAHRKSHSHKPEDSYCVTCDRQYKNVILYRNHLNSSSKHCQKKFECHDCGKKFWTRSSLRFHIELIHMKKSKYNCSLCGKTFNTPFSLRQHVSFVHDKVPRNKDKICTICGKGFSSNIILRHHMNGHTSARPYKCDVCSATFGHSASLYTHNKLVHLKLKRNTNRKKS